MDDKFGTRPGRARERGSRERKEIVEEGKKKWERRGELVGSRGELRRGELRSLGYSLNFLFSRQEQEQEQKQKQTEGNDC
jgi:hypothetical protein